MVKKQELEAGSMTNKYVLNIAQVADYVDDINARMLTYSTVVSTPDAVKNITLPYSHQHREWLDYVKMNHTKVCRSSTLGDLGVEYNVDQYLVQVSSISKSVTETYGICSSIKST